jgi:hypothetical protein
VIFRCFSSLKKLHITNWKELNPTVDNAVGNYCRVAKRWTNKAETAGQDTVIYPYFLNLPSSIRCDDAFSWHDRSSSAFILFVTWSNIHGDTVIFAQHFLIQEVLQWNSTTSAEWFIVIISVPATNIHHWMFGQMLLGSVNSVTYTVHVLLLLFVCCCCCCCWSSMNLRSYERVVVEILGKLQRQIEINVEGRY